MSNIDSTTMRRSGAADSRSPVAACCGGPANGGDACCARDAEAKEQGEGGCGCDAAEPDPAIPVRPHLGCCSAPRLDAEA